jgi:aromatic ring-opening dioxygenase LigB subunit
MKGFQVKARRNLFSNTNFSKFIAIQKSEIKLLKNSNKKEILLLKVMLETILFRLKIKTNNYKWE